MTESDLPVCPPDARFPILDKSSFIIYLLKDRSPQGPSHIINFAKAFVADQNITDESQKSLPGLLDNLNEIFYSKDGKNFTFPLESFREQIQQIVKDVSVRLFTHTLRLRNGSDGLTFSPVLSKIYPDYQQEMIDRQLPVVDFEEFKDSLHRMFIRCDCDGYLGAYIYVPERLSELRII